MWEYFYGIHADSNQLSWISWIFCGFSWVDSHGLIDIYGLMYVPSGNHVITYKWTMFP